MRTQRDTRLHCTERCHLQAEERGLRGHRTCRHLDPGLPASRTVRNTSVLLKPYHRWYFVTAALINWDSGNWGRLLEKGLAGLQTEGKPTSGKENHVAKAKGRARSRRLPPAGQKRVP